MKYILNFILILVTVPTFTATSGNRAKDYPQVVLNNGLIKVTILLPDAEKGYYRSTRFDWSGIITQFKYNDYTYFQALQNPEESTHPVGHAF